MDNNLFSFLRHSPRKTETMTGVTQMRKLCACCKTHKNIGGCKMIDIGTKTRSFVCADCVTQGKHLLLK